MKCNLIHQAPIWAIRLLSTVCLLLFVTTPLQAANSVESNETLPAVGRMPVLLNAPNLPVGPIASGATLPVSDKAIVGVPLTLADMGFDLSTYISTNFRDDDGDAEDGTLYEWLIDGEVVGTIYTFTPQVEHGGQLLSLRLTPRTQNGDPHTGNSITSNTIVVRSAIIDNFIKPNLAGKNLNDAKEYCEVTIGNGYRLPSRSELKQLYQEASVAKLSGNNFQLCEYYGWPLNGFCGGDNNLFWTNEIFYANFHWVVDLNTGDVLGDPGAPHLVNQVACFR